MDFSKNFSSQVKNEVYVKKYSIVIKDLKLVLHCGDIQEEKILGIETLMDFEIEAIDFLDYMVIYKFIEDYSKHEFKYLEDFCFSLAKEMFKTFKQIIKIYIYIRKKSIPFNIYAQEIGVKLEFEKN